MITVIYGSPSSGKTTNSARLQQHYCCRRVLDDVRYARLHAEALERARYPSNRVSPRWPVSGDLVLTTDHPDDLRKILPDARYIWVGEALRTIGVKARAPRT